MITLKQLWSSSVDVLSFMYNLYTVREQKELIMTGPNIIQPLPRQHLNDNSMLVLFRFYACVSAFKTAQIKVCLKTGFIFCRTYEDFTKNCRQKVEIMEI
jgi:hypothetical protein